MESKPPIVIEATWSTLMILMALWTLLVGLLGAGYGLTHAPKAPSFTVGTYIAGDDGFVPQSVQVEQVRVKGKRGRHF